MVIHICELESYLHHQIFKRRSFSDWWESGIAITRSWLRTPDWYRGAVNHPVQTSCRSHAYVTHSHVTHSHAHVTLVWMLLHTFWGESPQLTPAQNTKSNLDVVIHVGCANLTFSSSQVSPFLKYEDWKVQDRTALSSEVHPCLKHPCVAGIPKDITECSPNFTLQPLQLSKSSELIYICKPVPIQISVTIAGIPSPLIKGKSQMWNPKKFVSLQKRTPS